ncbi:hypothetical protein [Corynebacterium sp.]|uniref:hypothetical protein n=1 Tax=Corynebacterium sp. TaxID=1720 RepID=UPI0026DF5C19|nr:hypothetical protein [Corynebacterium sp.]MDO5512968.1 hypothetical protein [Corynebacterium sp.]
MRALIYLVLGAALLIAGWFWAAALGHAVMAIVAALLMGAGGALIIVAIAIGLDKYSPTSRKL